MELHINILEIAPDSLVHKASGVISKLSVLDPLCIREKWGVQTSGSVHEKSSLGPMFEKFYSLFWLLAHNLQAKFYGPHRAVGSKSDCRYWGCV